MAKKLSVIFSVLICLMLSGCQLSMKQFLYATQPQTTEAPAPVTTQAETAPVFAEQAVSAATLPEGTTLYGYDFGGLTCTQAEKMLRGILSNYRLTLTVNGEELVFTGETLGLDLSQTVFDAWTAGGSGEGLLFFQESAVHTAIEKALGEPARDAAIAYNDSAERFVTVSARTGTGIQTDAAMEAVRQALATLSPTASAQVSTYIRLPGVTNSHGWITSAIDAANRYLELELTYTFADSTETVSKAQLAGLLSINENFTVSVSEDGVRSLVSLMAGRHGTDSRSGTFGEHTVTCYGTVIDQAAMAEHLLNCLQELRSDSFTVPYLPSGAPDAPYGGNFVEADLTNQQLTVWQDGKAVVSVPTVSGSVPNGDRTRGGIFSIYEKDTRCWLVGSDFRDYVNYWIAFNGNIGIHDAAWRQSFGDSIYRYDGSHGCINIPASMAETVYSNVSVGTRVIVHGGETGADIISQALSGTAVYSLSTDTAPFHLDIAALHTGTDILYETGDPRVVTVSSTGLVTVIGPGSTQVTVRSAAIGPLQAAEFTVEITVS